MKNTAILKTTVWISVILLTLWGCGQKETVPANSARTDQPLFEILDSTQTGIVFTNELTESTFMNGILDNYYYNGAGLAVADFNGDGLQDVYFLSTLYDNALYLNRGDLQFEEVAEAAGVASVRGYQVGAAVVDINADGRSDLYLSTSGKFNDPDEGYSLDPENRRNLLFVNMGNDENGIPRFENQAAAYGLDIALYSTHAAFLDYDRDGDLDLFLINQFPDDYDVKDIARLLNHESPNTGDRLYENRGGTFVEVSQKAGLVTNGITVDLGVAVGDVNNDGWPDVYVSNDLPGKDHLYLNQRNGSFRQVEDEAVKHMPYASMGNDMADFNNDGWIDIFTLDMASEDNLRQKTSIKIMKSALYNALAGLGLHHQYMFNCLQLNNGVHGNDQVPVFSEIAQMAGIPATDWSWGPLVFDMDNDGRKDLYIANGIRRDLINLDFIIFKNRQFAAFREGKIDAERYVGEVMKMMPVRHKPDYFYRNNGQLGFEKKNGSWVEDLNTCNNGSAYADFDNDGDMDLVVNNSWGNSFIYKNLAREQNRGNYLQFELEGPEQNPQGIGSRVVVQQEHQQQIIEQYLSRGFQSAGTSVLHLGVGSDELIPELAVIWPDGRKQILRDVPANQRLTLRYAEADQVHDYAYALPSYFGNSGDLPGIRHTHVENDFDDFRREFMLPHRMSTLGPALARADVDGNGLEDLFVGGALGHSSTLYLQMEEGFVKAGHQAWGTDLNKEDVSATFFDADGDGDGDLDLFLGGRQAPGLYPNPVSSYLLRNDSEDGKLSFRDVSADAAPMLSQMGMVSDAAWTDVDRDGSVDLVVVGEWMAPRILLNSNGVFTEKTGSGLENESGWWNCLTAADFDGDGDTDLVAGNLGLNYNFKGNYDYPFEVFAGDMDNNGKQDIIMANYNEGVLYPWHGLMRSNHQLPFIKYRFQTYDAFGRASLEEIVGLENLRSALHYQARNFHTSYMENQGDGSFMVRHLDMHAQISATQQIIAEDVDSDGHLDLLLTGNLYGSESEITRADASVSLLMRGDGTGNFKVVPSVESGLILDGDIRDALLLKVGSHGKRHLVAARNNGPLTAVPFLVD